MTSRLILACFFMLSGAARALAVELPIEANEAKVFEKIIADEKFEVEVRDLPSWSKSNLVKSLAAYGIDPNKTKSIGIVVKDKTSMFLGFVYDADGHVLALSGNGPWLRNDSLRALKDLPELRILRIDHNGFVGRDPRAAEFDGRGFDALADSKLSEIKIGLGFSDRGMEQCAKIKGLRSMTVAHSQASQAGIDHFAGHPNLTEFSIAEMGSARVTGKALGAIAKIPRLTHVGCKECYLRYKDGFELLAPLRGQLVEIDLTMSIAAQQDLDKMQADHPQAKILTISPAEIVKRHKFIAANLAKQAPPELAAPLKQALEQ